MTDSLLTEAYQPSPQRWQQHTNWSLNKSPAPHTITDCSLSRSHAPETITDWSLSKSHAPDTITDWSLSKSPAPNRITDCSLSKSANIITICSLISMVSSRYLFDIISRSRDMLSHEASMLSELCMSCGGGRDHVRMLLGGGGGAVSVPR